MLLSSNKISYSFWLSYSKIHKWFWNRPSVVHTYILTYYISNIAKLHLIIYWLAEFLILMTYENIFGISIVYSNSEKKISLSSDKLFFFIRKQQNSLFFQLLNVIKPLVKMEPNQMLIKTNKFYWMFSIQIHLIWLN